MKRDAKGLAPWLSCKGLPPIPERRGPRFVSVVMLTFWVVFSSLNYTVVTTVPHTAFFSLSVQQLSKNAVKSYRNPQPISCLLPQPRHVLLPLSDANRANRLRLRQLRAEKRHDNETTQCFICSSTRFKTDTHVQTAIFKMRFSNVAGQSWIARKSKSNLRG